MIGKLDPSCRQVTVVGAGIAGLLAAYRLDRAGYEVTLLEESHRAGGLIETQRTSFGPAEAAAHSTLVTPEVRKLFDELGVELLPVRNRSRFVFRDGKARKFPLGFFEAVGAFLRAYFVLPERKGNPDALTVEEWGLRHFGRAAVRNLLHPFVTGVYGVRPSELQVGAAFPGLVIPRGHSFLSYQLHKKLRGKRKPSGPMMAPKDGMGSLVSRLDQILTERLGDRYRKGVPVTELPTVPNLVLALPADRAANLIQSADAALASALRRIQYTPLLTATAFVERAALVAEPQGVGVLMSADAQRKCLGILFNSSAFDGRTLDPSRWASFTVLFGGSIQPEVLNQDDASIKRLIRSEIEQLFGLKDQAQVHCFIRRWTRAVPRYDAAAVDAWKAAEAGWCLQPGRILFGNYTGQVSIRGMIESSASMAAGLHA